ncbi:MAG TPA: hypothetical protein VG077_13480 [Verrucomicrobiae bacterium]|nr:hypothetical protein [Verrucomicrobiae bacterium]
MERTQSLSLDGRVFHGIPKSPPPQINNVEFEARGDMYASEIVFAAFTTDQTREVYGDWIIKYLPELVEREIPTDIGLVGMDATDLSTEGNMRLSNLQREVTTTRFPSEEEWLAHLLSELRKVPESQ